MVSCIRFRAFAVLVCLPGAVLAAQVDEAIVALDNDFAHLAINASAEVTALSDRASGVDYVDHSTGAAIAYLTEGGKRHPATRATRDADRIRLGFGDSDATAELKITAHRSYFVIEVVSVSGQDAQSLDLIDLPLTLGGDPSEPVAACALALNLQTNVLAIPGATGRMQATCYAKFGFAGAKAAIILCPQPRLRDVMKKVVAAADELPQTRIGGPWALDAPSNQGSYILECTGKVGPVEIDRWIKMLREIGISQLDFHCGRSFRFGDYTPNPDVYPHGLASVRAMTNKLHAAGMLAGLHTYAFFIAKDSPYVTPVPRPGLAFDATYTLIEGLAADATTVPVAESTADVSAVTGFFIRNSATIRIDDELITYKGVCKDAPFGFIECQRGAYGTIATAHAAGAKVRHLEECFGLFVPDPDSPLFLDVIDRTATVYNDGGFDMIYLDALDGSDILGGSEWSWYYGSKFVFELANRLKKPALFEMSTFHHHLWYVRSRMGAWDCPARAPKVFVDIHRLANQSCRHMFLPANLGWWAIFNWEGIQPERTTPDVIEYLCCKCIADDCGLSFPAGFTPDAYESSTHIRRLGAIVRQYEELRRSGKVPAAVRKRLGVPGDEFTLETSPDGQARFRPITYEKHKIANLDSPDSAWNVTNRFDAQPLQVRIEALLSAEAYDSPDSVVIEDFGDPARFDAHKATVGTPMIEKATEPTRAAAVSGHFAVDDSRAGSWAMVGRTFSPCIDLANKGLGLWVYGDGRGEVLNLQIKSPLSAFGGVCDRYVKIDFNGWKYVELIEPESDDIVNHGWPYMPRRSEWAAHREAVMGYAYPTFMFHVVYNTIETLNLWYGDLPGGGVSCYVSPIKAVPLTPCTLRDPAITVGGKTITFPVELQSGQYLEFRSSGDCKVYDAKGDVVTDVTPTGERPELQAGTNEIGFAAKAVAGPHPRAAVTVICEGEAL